MIKFALIFFTVILATFVSWYTNSMSLIGIDDANIYMVYMKNFANGHGFVYNIGGERVEGFTSLLWTLIGALAFYIKDNPEILLLVLNVFMISYCLWTLVCYIDGYFKDNRLITPASSLLIGSLIVIPGYFHWTVFSLLETGLWSLLLITITLNLLKGRKNGEFCILLILLTLCRPESMLWGAYFIFAKFIKHFFETKSIKNSFALIMPALIVFIVSIVGLISWREYYFGFPLPNTYYAKVSSNLIANIKSGIRYNLHSLSLNPLILLSFLFVVKNLYTVIRQKNIPKQYDLLFVNGVVLLTLSIPLYSGGDHFGLSRFIQPTFPLFLLALLMNLNFLKFQFNYYFSMVFIIVFVFANRNPIHYNLLDKSSLIALEWSIATSGRKKSEKLNLFFKNNYKYPSQGVIAAGGTAFSYKGFTIDLLGLNNVEMAHASEEKNAGALKNHASFNKEVFYKQSPEIIPIGNCFKKGNIVVIDDFHKVVLLQIFKEKKFSDRYSPVKIENKNLDYPLVLFASNAFLDSLNRKIYKYEVVEFE